MIGQGAGPPWGFPHVYTAAVPSRPRVPLVRPTLNAWEPPLDATDDPLYVGPPSLVDCPPGPRGCLLRVGAMLVELSAHLGGFFPQIVTQELELAGGVGDQAGGYEVQDNV